MYCSMAVFVSPDVTLVFAFTRSLYVTLISIHMRLSVPDVRDLAVF